MHGMNIKINSFQINFSTSKKKIRSNYIREILATFQNRTCAMYSSRLSKEGSSKYENNNFTFYLYDEKFPRPQNGRLPTKYL
jgi:hypothetical protein